MTAKKRASKPASKRVSRLHAFFDELKKERMEEFYDELEKLKRGERILAYELVIERLQLLELVKERLENLERDERVLAYMGPDAQTPLTAEALTVGSVGVASTKPPKIGAKTGADSTWVDPDDAPEWTQEQFERADLYYGDKLIRRGRPPLANPKKALKLRIDADVIEYFRATGPGWQTRINDTLRRAAKLGHS